MFDLCIVSNGGSSLIVKYTGRTQRPESDKMRIDEEKVYWISIGCWSREVARNGDPVGARGDEDKGAREGWEGGLETGTGR